MKALLPNGVRGNIPFCWCFLMAIALVMQMATANGQVRPFAESVGLNVKFEQGEPPKDLAMLPELGVRWVRDSVNWYDMEPEAGRYVPFPEAFQRRLAFYKLHRIGVVFGVWYDNTRAYPNTPTDPYHSADAEAYGRYAAYAAGLLRGAGVTFVMELYNEPHNSLKWLGGNWNGKPPSPWLDHYLKMVAAAGEKIKRVDPTIPVLVNDDMWIIHYWYLNAGMPPSVDGLAVHPYVKSWPEISACEQDTDWCSPFVVVDADGSFRSAVTHLRNQAKAKLGRTPAIWATEWGWPVGEEIAGRKTTELMVADMLPRAFIASYDAGVETLCWFSAQDSVDGPMGLTSNSGARRPAFWAFKTMVKELGACTSEEHIVGADHPTSGLQVYRFSDPRGNVKLVAWDVDGSMTGLLTEPEGASASAVNTTGQPAALEGGDRGGRRISLDRGVVYVSGVSARATIRPEGLRSTPPAYLFP